MKLSTLDLKRAALAAGFGFLSIARLGAQATGSLSVTDIENSQLKVNLERVLEEKRQLTESLTEVRKALIDSEKTVVDTRKSLANATGEGEIFKRKAMELQLRIEALGLETAGGNTAKLEQRLLNAVSDLRILSDEKKNLQEALIRLSEACSLFAKTASTSNADARLTLETEIRNANVAMGLNSPGAAEAAAMPATISDGMAISVKEEYALVVVNLGSSQGVKVGMPFKVIRGDRIVGSVRVVDVREKIAGAVIQNLTTEKDRVQVGDRLMVDAVR